MNQSQLFTLCIEEEGGLWVSGAAQAGLTSVATDKASVATKLTQAAVTEGKDGEDLQWVFSLKFCTDRSEASQFTLKQGNQDLAVTFLCRLQHPALEVESSVCYWLPNEGNSEEAAAQSWAGHTSKITWQCRAGCAPALWKDTVCSSSIGARGASLSAGLGQAVLLKEASSKKTISVPYESRKQQTKPAGKR